MIVGITGASGFLGRAITAELSSAGHTIIGYSRSPDRAIPSCSEVREFTRKEHADFSGLDALIHLAGESILGMWSKGKKAAIRNSRIHSTDHIVEQLAGLEAAKRPFTFICASAIGIYGNRGADWLDEESDAGFGFLADVCNQWEKSAAKAEALDIRTVSLRIGFVIGREGGAIPVMKSVFQKNLGGPLGSGKQYMSWVHVDDVAGITRACLENDAIQGAVNVASPNPVTNKEMTKAIAAELGKIAIIPAPTLALKCLPGGMSEIFLTSVRATPAVMNSHDYKWRYPELKPALQDAL